MATTAIDIERLAGDRQFARRILDSRGTVVQHYADWKQRISDIDLIYTGRTTKRFPDGQTAAGELVIPNYVQLGIEDRARTVGQGRPSLVCPSATLKSKDKLAAEKRERILSNYWRLSYVSSSIRSWAADAMGTGIAAVEVLPDTSVPKEERFPLYCRIDPRHVYPGPIFAPGPWLDDAIVIQFMDVAEVARRYGTWNPAFLANDQAADKGKVRVIKYYDETQAAVICQKLPSENAAKYGARLDENSGWMWLVEPFDHRLEHCPLVIGTRTGLNGEYRGDFDGILSMMKTQDSLVTMALDAAAQGAYPERVVYELESPEDYGPDATHRKTSPNGSLEYVQTPGLSFSYHQLMNITNGWLQQSSLLSPSRLGDPNESIVSAAGINASQSGLVQHVKDIESNVISKMLEAANQLAFKADEEWCDTQKEVLGISKGRAFQETYVPSKDIAGQYQNRIFYGTFTGLDDINASVMNLQQWAGGNGLISKRTAQENSPEVEDPTRESKQQVLEKLDEAVLAGLLAQASQGAMSSEELAAIRAGVENDDVSLHDVITTVREAAVAAQPQAPQGGMPQAPGQPGQQVPQAPLPPLSQLMVTTSGGVGNRAFGARITTGRR